MGEASILDPEVQDQKVSRSRGGSAGEEAPRWEQLPPCRPRPSAGRGGGDGQGALPLSSSQAVASATSPWGEMGKRSP